MKIIENLTMGKMEDKYIVFPTDDATKVFSGFIELNETGYDIWCGIEKGLSLEQIAESFTKKYVDITYNEAYEYTKEIVQNLIDNGIIIEG